MLELLVAGVVTDSLRGDCDGSESNDCESPDLAFCVSLTKSATVPGEIVELVSISPVKVELSSPDIVTRGGTADKVAGRVVAVESS